KCSFPWRCRLDEPPPDVHRPKKLSFILLGTEPLSLRVEWRCCQYGGRMRAPQHHHVDAITGRCALYEPERKRHANAITIGARGHSADPLAILKYRFSTGGIGVRARNRFLVEMQQHEFFTLRSS